MPTNANSKLERLALRAKIEAVQATVEAHDGDVHAAARELGAHIQTIERLLWTQPPKLVDPKPPAEPQAEPEPVF